MITTRYLVRLTARADDVPGPPQGCWTYADYAALPDDGRRYEILDGMLYMVAGPNTAHQRAVGRFFYHLTTHVELTGRGMVFHSPYDVELAPKDVAQPDVVVVLNAHLDIIKASHIVGVPDLLVEVLSPGTAAQDRRRKRERYARAGVPEYWIANPFRKMVEVLVLEGDAYRSLGVFSGAETLPSRIVPDFPVPVEQFFAYPL